VTALSPELARRIDRLSRAAHAFHRFAHHPLCERYEGELVRLGRRTRLCRGCLFAVTGTIAGLALGVAWPVSGPAALGLALLGIEAGRRVRPGKLVTRFVPGAGLAAAFAAGLASRSAAGLALAAASAFCTLGAWALYRQRGPDRSPCETCPEYRTVEICSGFQPLLRRERAFGRLTSRWIDRASSPAP
jgi:hypothetical protein